MAPETPSQLGDKQEESLYIEHRTTKDSGHGGFIIDPVAEKKLLRKCDLHVLPSLTLIFFLSFMDRTNIG